MSNFVFNISKGRGAHYATLPGSNDALVLVPIETTGIESDATLIDYDTLSALLAAANNEQTTMGRKVITSVTVTVDDANDRTDVDFADPVWTDATGNAISAIIVCYDPDTTGGTDADLIPITKHDFVATPNGGDLTAQVATSGYYRAQG